MPGAWTPAEDAIRFIPTRVGNANSRATPCAVLAVHPHACGECLGVGVGVQRQPGSSPRVWGMRSGPWWGWDFNRFIPTRVGNALFSFDSSAMPSVHPHACGECNVRPADEAFKSGSSPRVWGMPSENRLRFKIERFIPTRVGNAPASMLRTARSPVHPHACGECRWRGPCPLRQGGSSPRVWGMRGLRPCGKLSARFIPTRVGNAALCGSHSPREPVHPHACGECIEAGHLCRPKYGSSPRVWGMLLDHVGNLGRHRFIPTRVGNAPRLPTNQRPCAVHPHACGECSDAGCG